MNFGNQTRKLESSSSEKMAAKGVTPELESGLSDSRSLSPRTSGFTNSSLILRQLYSLYKVWWFGVNATKYD